MIRIVALALLFLTSHGGAVGQEIPIRWEQLPSLPDTPGLAGPFAGVSNGVLLVAGGANFPDAPPWKGGTKVWHDAIYGMIDGQWKIVGRLPTPCAYGVSFQTADGIICAGGSNAEMHFADVFRLQWRKDRIEVHVLPSLPGPVANACGTSVGSVVYLAGGTDSPTSSSALKTLFSMETADPRPEWRKLPDCPGPARMLSVAASQGDSFFLFSGAALTTGPDAKTVRTYLNDAWRFDTRSTSWTPLSALPSAVVAAPSPAPVTDAGLILIVGGDDGSKVSFQPPEAHPGFLANALVYDIRNDVWSKGPGLSASRVTVPVVAWHGSFVITSGEERPGVRSPEVWQLFIPSGNP